jgi:hypothetical protein
MKMNTENSEARQVGDFFNGYADDFDSIYGGKRNPVSRLIDRLFRRSMLRCFQHTLSDLSDPSLCSFWTSAVGLAATRWNFLR